MSAPVRVKGMKGGAERVMLGGVILSERPARRKRMRGEWRFSKEMLRLREIEKLITHRHGGQLPDPGDTDDRETCLDYVRAAALSLSGQDMGAWCRRWAPWVLASDLVPIEAAARTRRRMMRADGVAGLLGVTMAVRTALGMKTIGACDMTTADRRKLAKETKRERDRKRQEAKRRAAGCDCRKSPAAPTLKTLKPWKEAGVSRATWFRRRRETPTSRVVSIGNGDTRVSQPHTQPGSRRLQGHADGNAGRVASGGRGSGTESPAGLQGAAPHGIREEAA